MSGATDERALVAARNGDQAAFAEVVGRYRRELHAHCYRMLGSTQDAEDAMQETLLAAWRGLPGFESRSSLRSWLYRIATNVCLRLVERRPRRMLTPDVVPAATQTDDLGEPIAGPVWLEPYFDHEPIADSRTDPTDRLLETEGVELAFIAALQHLPGTQRAVLILREVLGFSAAEVAEALDTTPASVNSAMQRARQAVDDRVTGRPQREELRDLGDDGIRTLVDRFVTAWERADVPALVGLLSEDARFTMPPLPAWFDGRDAVARFLRERVFGAEWRLVPIRASGQIAFACYIRPPGEPDFALGAVNLLAVSDGRIARIDGFTDPTRLAAAGVPDRLPPTNAARDR